MRDRIPTKILDNGAIRYGVYDESETLLRYEYMKAEDEPSQLGTPLNKNTLLKDATASKIGLTQSNPTVDDAFNGIQDKVSSHETEIQNLNSQYTNLFTSVSDGKQLVASAITDKGVSTAPDATFSTMATNIRKISSIPDGVYKIDLTASPSIGGVVSGGGYASSGMKIQVGASPTNGYTFNGWKKSGTTVSSDTSYLFQVTGDTSLIAQFNEITIIRYTVTLSVDPGGSGSVSGGGSYDEGASVTVRATAEDGYDFYGWRMNGSYVSYSSSYTFTISSNTSLTAVFEESYVEPESDLEWSYVDTPFKVAEVAFGNGKFVAIPSSAGNQVLYSTNGQNWSVASLPSSKAWENIIYFKNKFVVTGASHGNILTSTDGITWTEHEQTFIRTSYHMACNDNVLVGISFGSTEWLSYSYDGVEWTRVNLTHGAGKGIAYGNGKFVIANSGSCFHSSDGVNWTFEDLTQSPYPNLTEAFAFGGGKFLSVSTDRSSASTNGIDWNASLNVSMSNPKCMAYGSGKFVSIGIDAYGTSGRFAVTEDGGDSFSYGSMQYRWSHMAYGNGVFVATSYQDQKIAYVNA